MYKESNLTQVDIGTSQIIKADPYIRMIARLARLTGKQVVINVHNPEKHTPESTDHNPIVVARGKAETMQEFYQSDPDYPENSYALAFDTVTYYVNLETGEKEDLKRYLRQLTILNKKPEEQDPTEFWNQFNEVMDGAHAEMTTRYANNNFGIEWNIGVVLRRGDGKEMSVKMTIFALFNALGQEVIDQAFTVGSELKAEEAQNVLPTHGSLTRNVPALRFGPGLPFGEIYAADPQSDPVTQTTIINNSIRSNEKISPRELASRVQNSRVDTRLAAMVFSTAEKPIF